MKVNPEIKAKIIAAANTLAAESNENPTNDQVRDRMGGGSLSHISPVMREWRESRKADVVAILDMPSDLKKVIETSMGQMWTAASKLASASFETVRQEAETAIKAATGERDEALTEINQLEEHINELQKALAGKDQSIKHLQGEIETERTQSEKLNSDSNQLKSENTIILNRIEELKADLTASKNDAKSDLKVERDRAEKQQDMLEKRHGTEKAQLLDEATKLRGRADVLAAEKAKVDMESAQLEERVTQLAEAGKQAEKREESLLKQLAEAGKQAEKREESLLRQLDELTKSIAKMKPTDTKKTS